MISTYFKQIYLFYYLPSPTIEKAYENKHNQIKIKVEILFFVHYFLKAKIQKSNQKRYGALDSLGTFKQP